MHTSLQWINGDKLLPYRFLEDVAIADVAFEATGNTLEELFESAGQALTNVMVEELSSVQQLETREIRLESKELDMLLFNFLQELIFLKDVDLLLFSSISTKVGRDGDLYKLTARVSGEKLDAQKHELKVDVKAVTMHHFEVARVDGGWRTQVILDI